MLTVLASNPIRPEIAAIDRDPGVVTLLATIVKGLHRLGSRTRARLRAAHQAAVEAEVFSSASAWPYNHRT